MVCGTYRIISLCFYVRMSKKGLHIIFAVIFTSSILILFVFITRKCHIPISYFFSKTIKLLKNDFDVVDFLIILCFKIIIILIFCFERSGCSTVSREILDLRSRWICPACSVARWSLPISQKTNCCEIQSCENPRWRIHSLAAGTAAAWNLPFWSPTLSALICLADLMKILAKMLVEIPADIWWLEFGGRIGKIWAEIGTQIGAKINNKFPFGVKI